MKYIVIYRDMFGSVMVADVFGWENVDNYTEKLTKEGATILSVKGAEKGQNFSLSPLQNSIPLVIYPIQIRRG